MSNPIINIKYLVKKIVIKGHPEINKDKLKEVVVKTLLEAVSEANGGAEITPSQEISE
jgi:hypothetical protein